MFESKQAFLSAVDHLTQPDNAALSAARARQQQLTKPPGSLGRLEDIAIWLAGWQGKDQPIIDNVQIIVFAGNHGVVAQGVSPYPSDVTAQMVANFAAGGAAINALAQRYDFALDVHPLELERPTHDFTVEPAMDETDCLAALNAGAEAVKSDTDLLVLGEMGIGNTTVASTLTAATFGGGGQQWAGPGTGLDKLGVNRKADVIDRALALHSGHCSDAFETMRRLGGRELAAIVGAVLAARAQRLPVVLDGFIATASIAPLAHRHPGTLAHCIAGHVSAEPGHQNLLAKLGLEPLLNLGMRLGEGTGATLAAAVIQGAVATHNAMATFAEAGVTDRQD